MYLNRLILFSFKWDLNPIKYIFSTFIIIGFIVLNIKNRCWKSSDAFCACSEFFKNLTCVCGGFVHVRDDFSFIVLVSIIIIIIITIAMRLKQDH